MPSPADLLPDGPDGFARRLLRLEREIRELRAARSSERTGALRTYTPAGTLIVETGPIAEYPHLDGSEQQGVRTYREDGSLVTAVQAQPAVTGVDRQSWMLYDRSGNALLGDDPISGLGLAGPYLPFSFGRAWYLDWEGTNSGSFVDVHQTAIYKQHAMATVVIAHTNDTAGATGQVRLMVNGVATGTTISTTFSGGTTSTIGPFALPGAHLDTVDLRVQARVLSGSGNTRCEVLSAWTIKS
ncbi:hypothetical protein [Streptomyces sp. A1136]|uniref:hypothetical protein n=1 Tax=Streptomyces sp. A1136 TaxID=2563102 RepID=UPI00109E59D9|nr:hypothetical protein [Streptomyces sp. A1136]THA56093.1 hypothetical protein E6R62_12150 [Streptomyces sp. A1136]